jgi:putative hydrolase of the HAD superfamily
MAIEWVGLDADDTLWHSEGVFQETQAWFCEVLDPYCDPDVNLVERLDAVERRNIDLLGYGVKAFTLSMVEAAVEITGGRVPSPVLAALVERGKAMLRHPVELLDGVAEVVPRLAASYRLAVITKGDLVHQERKLDESGLLAHVHAVSIVNEKDPATYRRVLAEHGIEPSAFVMVGNAMRSDVLPVLAIGGRAVHIPYALTWGHEHAVADCEVPTLASIRDLPDWLCRHG